MFDKKLYMQQYRQIHKDRIKAQQEKYNKDNKNKINLIRKIYTKNNQDQIKESRRKTYQKYKEKINKNNREYRYTHRDKIKIINSNYHKKFPEKQLESNKRQVRKLGLNWKFSFHQVRYALRAWSILIRKRDKFTCQICGEKGNLVHHLIHKSKYPLLAFNVNNGITLCKKCHYEVHNMRLGV